MSSESGSSLRDLIEARSALLVPGVTNALSANVAQDAGFEALYVSGAGVSNMNLGVPDIGLITLNDLCNVVTTVRRVCDLPLIVDADTGFGNAVNVWHTTRALELAGANAMQLEDQVFPKRCGHFEGKAVTDAAEMVEKIHAARDARRSRDFLIIARTDARAVHGLDEAIRRAALYAEAGADVTFVEAPANLDEIRTIVRSLPMPQLVNMVIGGKTAPCTIEELRDLGVGLVLYANAALQGALLGMQRALARLRETGMITEADGLVATFADRQLSVRKPRYDDLEKRYATGQ